MKFSKPIIVGMMVALLTTSAFAKLKDFKGDNGKFGYKDESGVVVIPLKYDYAKRFFSDNGLAPVKLNGKWGYINAKDEVVVPLKYDNANRFSDNGLTGVELNGKHGYINAKGEEVIPLKYDDTYGFYDNGLAPVRLNGKWGCINAKDEVVVLLKYDDAWSFSDNGLAPVKLNGKWGTVDKSGKEIIKPKYDKILFSNGAGVWTYVELNGKHGILDSYNGSTIMPIKYSSADDAHSAYQSKEAEKRAVREAENEKYNKKYRDINRKKACKNLYIGKIVKYRGGAFGMEWKAIILGIGDTMMTIKDTSNGYIQEVPCDEVY
ncbi:WG repeat-containing protein [Sulfuricurvum sp.]|uniref:WG repeat-containing protein n=1 Tax=Sulfuricurvum sp. TaxID=2025608 RepID=UPI003BB77DE4